MIQKSDFSYILQKSRFFLRWMPPGCIRTSTTIYAVSEVNTVYIYQGSIPHPPSSQHWNNYFICLVYLNFLYIVAFDLRYDSSPCCLLVWTVMFSECLLSFCILNCWVHLSICFAYSCFPSWSQWLSSSTIILHILSAKWYLRLLCYIHFWNLALKRQSSEIFDLLFFIIRICMGHWSMG